MFRKSVVSACAAPLATLGILLGFAGPARGLEEPRVLKTIEPAGSMEIDPLDFDGPSVLEFTLGDRHLAIRVTPDGLVQVLQSDAGAGVVVDGAGGSNVKFDLLAGELVSIWPVDRIVLFDAGGRLAMNVETADWAFTVRADEVRDGGLPVVCNNAPYTLQVGQRLDTRMEGGQVAFGITGEFLVPETVVGVPPAPPGSPAGPPAGPLSDLDLPGAVVAGVYSGGSAGPLWSIAAGLPTVTWEVIRPGEVSP